MKNNTILSLNKILFIVIILAIFFRFYNLSSVPPSPSLDEVSIGYNAYSILTTGTDEYGTHLPILLRAYDDWRPALYVYLVISFIKFFGVNVLAVRLPSAILSVFTVIAVYFLANEITRRGKIKNSRTFALLATAILAVSPWHVYISRLGHEVNAAFSFFIFAVLFFFMWTNTFVKKNTYEKVLLPLSAIFFGLSFYSYQSTKIVIPLLVLSLGVLFFKKLKERKREVVVSCLVGVLVIMPVLFELFKPYGLIRFQGTNVFTSNQSLLENSAKQLLKDKENGDVVGQIIHNRRIVYFTQFLNAYTSHFNPFWLVSNSSDEPFKVPNFGIVYIFEIGLIILGIYSVVKTQILDMRTKIFLFIWAAVSIIPGALTTGYPHAMRILSILPLPQFFTAFGVLVLLQFSRYSKIVFLTLYVVFVSYFAYSYFVLFPKELSHQFQYGLLDSLSFAEDRKGEYDTIVVSSQDALFQSYMFYLYKTQYDPFKYISRGGTGSGGFNEEHKIDAFFFTPFADSVKVQGKALLLLPARKIPAVKARSVREFTDINGKVVIIAWET